MTLNERHLTDDDLDELMMGVDRPELQAHCAACAPCCSRISAFSASIQPFNDASLAWSQARSHTFTRDLSQHRQTWRLTANAARSAVAMLVLGLVASLTAGMHLRPAQVTGESLATVTQPAPHPFSADARAQQIARDNAMMQAIDAELTEPESTPAALFRAAVPTAAQPASAQDRD